jgi:lipoprotein NlpD
MNVIRYFTILFLASLTFACSTTPAPVIDRLPHGKPNKLQSASIAHKAGMDWRPASYTVKKGDTLYSIGLEYGYDYKDIAQANNISAPYLIKIGQTLKFSTLNEAPASVETSPSQENSNGVVTYAIGNESPQETSISSPAAPPKVVAINEPKALREPYSEEAYKQPLPTAKTMTTTPSSTITEVKKTITDKTTVEAKQEVKTVEPKVETKPQLIPNGQLSWTWPTKGKVIANFNDAGNKGMDIAGKMGQAIHAAAPGKVIYSGSDLRGYGKLVIVKHNATYLSVYANNSLILVKEGQQVSSGQKIAEMGDTDSNTVKLHFEIRQQGKSVDPMKFLSAD